jgi:hypothetical protein
MFETEKELSLIASHYDGLFKLMEQDHGLILTISEMDDIIREAQKVVEKLKPDVRESRTTQPEPPQLAVGTILIAKDVCKPFGVKQELLIIGKEYPIIRITYNSIVICTEDDIAHSFMYDTWKKFFDIKQ